LCDATSSWVGQPAALVLCFHGKWQASSWACEAICAPYAALRGFIAACPQGLRDTYGNTGWNTGENSGFDAHDDVGFIRATINHIHASNNVPQRRTTAVGFSMGGGITYRLMCEASDLISAFAVYAQPGPGGQDTRPELGTGWEASWVQSCTPAVGRPLWAGIGTNDGIFSDADGIRGWEYVARNVVGCTGSLTTVRNVGGVTCVAFQSCLSEFCTYSGGTHRYPSNLGRLAGVWTTQQTTHDATPALWAFWMRDIASPPALPPTPTLPLGSASNLGTSSPQGTQQQSGQDSVSQVWVVMFAVVAVYAFIASTLLVLCYVRRRQSPVVTVTTTKPDAVDGLGHSEGIDNGNSDVVQPAQPKYVFM